MMHTLCIVYKALTGMLTMDMAVQAFISKSVSVSNAKKRILRYSMTL